MSEQQPAWAIRMEAKLDALLSALAEDDQGDVPAVDLDGAPLPRERSLDEPL
jgi:hypothetical protein